ncbi:MAG: hypothetical protein D6738_11045 [Acidobacteria bacterium]|nr:MAG: hypothetical protein D6738_11045 [Acidobacteriota bacterium]
MPTLLALLGLEPPPGIDGRDLQPTWESARGATDADYELESLHPARAWGWAPLAALVRGRYKYVRAPRPELYDLALDPGETRNVLAARPAIGRELAARLEALLRTDPAWSAGASGADDTPDPRTAERRAALRSLGYASGGAALPDEPRPDPKDAIAWLADLDRVRRLLTNPRDPRAAGAEAGAILAALLERNPANHPARLLLAEARLAAGDPAAALAVLAQARERAPWDERARVLEARAWLARHGDPDAPDAVDRAQRALREALRIRPRDADAARMLADLLVDQGRLAEARQVLAPLVEDGAADAALATMLGEIEAATGRADRARAAFEQALAYDPSHAPALEALGKLAFVEGDARAAAEWYRRALAAAPSARLARTLGALLLESLGDREGAREAFARALALEPRGPDAERVREILNELDAPESAAPRR